MSDTTDIEKKSLEAHVELCAERYKLLETKLAIVEEGVEETKDMVRGVNDKVSKMAEKNNDRLIAWGVAIIASLAGVCGWLLTHYINK
jgi:ectoine hydroxylase-related dioxygenase (phytanoyl-CoA dioxygenase family)